MKKIIIPIAVLASLGLIAPKFIGQRLNKDIESFITQINNFPGYQAKLVSTDNGWFGSSFVINFGYDPEYFAGLYQGQYTDDTQKSLFEAFGQFNVNAEINTQHGPIITQNGLSLGLAGWTLDVEDELFREFIDYAQEQSLYSVKGHVSLSSSVQFEDRIPNFNYVGAEQGIEWAFSGWEGAGHVSSNHSQYTGNIKQITGAMPFLNISVNDIVLDSTLQQSWVDIFSNPLYDSNGILSIASVDATSTATQEKTNLKNLSINAITDKNDAGTLMDMRLSYKLESFSAADFMLENMLLVTDFKNLEKSFIEAYQRLSQDPGGNPEAMKSILQNEFVAQLQANPEINISALSGQLNGGHFEGNIFTKLNDIKAIPETLEDPKFWLSHALVDANLNMDKSVTLLSAEQSVLNQLKANPDTAQMSEEEMQNIASQQAQILLDNFRQQGMLTETSEGYQITFSLKDSQAKLNGNPMPLPF
jgi:uncharacterized protein YdgA (DUF945 family)